MEDKRNATLFRAPTKRIQEAFKNYVSACVEFSWVACLEEEPVRLVTNPRKECKSLLGQFNGEDEIPGKSFVEWPAIVQNDVVRVAWQLFHRSRIGAKDTNEKRSDVAKNVQTRAHNIENERVKGPRAVVYETDSDLDARSSRISRSSVSSAISQQARKSRDSYAGHDHVHNWKPSPWRPTPVRENGNQNTRWMPANVASKPQRSVLEDMHSAHLLNINRVPLDYNGHPTAVREFRATRKPLSLPASATGRPDNWAQEGSSPRNLYGNINRSHNKHHARSTATISVLDSETQSENIQSVQSIHSYGNPPIQRKSKRKNSKPVYLEF